MGRVDGKIALITGAARGQGRSHALRLAGEGADIIAVDFNGAEADVDTIDYTLATEADLAETAALVEKLDRRVVTAVADVRSQEQLDAAVAKGLAEFGRIDIAIANAGIVSWGPVHEISEEQWKQMIDTNLTGVWHTIKAVVPTMLDAGKGSIVLTGSGAALSGPANLAHYTSAKHGLIGLMWTAANELSGRGIRINAVHPSQVDTPMIMHDSLFRLFRPDLPNPTRDDIVEPSQKLHIMPIPWVDPIDVSNAVLFLASDEARYITGVGIPIDAGAAIKSGY